MASSMIIIYKLDVVITTIQKNFKTFHMEKTYYRLYWKFLKNWNGNLIYATFWQLHIGMNVCQFPRNVLLELKLFKIDKAFVN